MFRPLLYYYVQILHYNFNSIFMSKTCSTHSLPLCKMTMVYTKKCIYHLSVYILLVVITPGTETDAYEVYF